MMPIVLGVGDPVVETRILRIPLSAEGLRAKTFVFREGITVGPQLGKARQWGSSWKFPNTGCQCLPQNQIFSVWTAFQGTKNLRLSHSMRDPSTFLAPSRPEEVEVRTSRRAPWPTWGLDQIPGFIPSASSDSCPLSAHCPQSSQRRGDS